MQVHRFENLIKGFSERETYLRIILLKVDFSRVDDLTHSEAVGPTASRNAELCILHLFMA